MAYDCLSKEKRAELQFIAMEYELPVDTQEIGKCLKSGSCMYLDAETYCKLYSIHLLICRSINLSISVSLFLLSASVMAAAIRPCAGQRHAGLSHGSYCLPHGLPSQPF